jgi:hypothetical protein
MEYLGAQVDVRKALGLCGLYHLDDKAIDDSIREAVKNDMQPGEWHFRARSS